MYAKYIKRLLDIVLSFVAIAVLLPFIAVLWVLTLIFNGSPALFRQRRITKNEKEFTMIKFRSMTDARDAQGKLLPDDARRTKFGTFLRGTSLDELPELFCILKGDLSIIGPRPLLPEYLPYYTEQERHRHDVRGGLVPPEVLYNDIMPTWENQFRYETEYAANVSFMLDVKILLATVRGVLKRSSENYGEYNRGSFVEHRTVRPEQPAEV